jgi:hypothetical protein
MLLTWDCNIHKTKACNTYTWKQFWIRDSRVFVLTYFIDISKTIGNKFWQLPNYWQRQLISHWLLQFHLQAAFYKFYGRYNDLVWQHNLSLDQMLPDVFCTNLKPFLTNRSWLHVIRTLYTWSGNRTDGACDRFTGAAYF